jgi:bacterioferritin (cytochrome b1)
MGSSIEDVIDSYEARVKIVGALMKKTVEVLKQFDLEQEEKVVELRDLLAKAESLRRKDFDNLMEKVWARRREKEKKVSDILDSFLKGQEEMVAWLRKVIADGNIGLEEFRLLSQNFITRQKQAEGELSRMLRELHLEQEELGTGLKQLLQKGEKVRIKNFKAMIKAIQLRQEGRQDEVGKMLDELWGVDEEVATQWRKVVSSTRD